MFSFNDLSGHQTDSGSAMTQEEQFSINGQCVFRKAGSSSWTPLTEDACQALKAIMGDKSAITDREKLQISEAKQELNELLLTALQMPNLSLFAGSGASRGDVGGPSMADLWEKSVQVVSADGKSVDFGEIAKTVNYLETNDQNIEHLLSQCDAYLSFNNSDVEITNFVRDVKRVILDECSSFIGKDGNDLSAHEVILQKLARRRARDPRLSIFTTNYDMCFETAASNLGMMVVDGFSYSRNRRFDGRYFNYDFVYRDESSNEFADGVFQLYKLHGSVSWERIDGNIYESLHPRPENAALIYPAKGKYQQSFIQPHLEMLSRFLDLLRRPNGCLLITGFGFNDDHLSEPIISAIKSNPSLRLVIVDFNAYGNILASRYSSSPYWKDLSDLCSSGFDVSFINGSFKQLADMIPNLRALSPAEKLFKAVKSAGLAK